MNETTRRLLKRVKMKNEKPKKSLHTTLSERAFVIMDLYKDLYGLDSYSQVIELALYLYEEERKRFNKKRRNKIIELECVRNSY